MAATAVISSSTFIRGRINGTGDLEIAGRVEGDVAVSGDVTVDTTGLVAANVSAARIVVRGAVKGDLSADEAIVVESGAKIVGDLRAPRIAIQPGGLVRGHVQTSGTAPARPRAAQASAAKAVPAAATKAAAAPVPAKKVVAPAAKPHRGSTLAGARPAPPAPVVPVLKKGTKAISKKR